MFLGIRSGSKPVTKHPFPSSTFHYTGCLGIPIRGCKKYLYPRVLQWITPCFNIKTSYFDVELPHLFEKLAVFWLQCNIDWIWILLFLTLKRFSSQIFKKPKQHRQQKAQKQLATLINNQSPPQEPLNSARTPQPAPQPAQPAAASTASLGLQEICEEPRKATGRTFSFLDGWNVEWCKHVIRYLKIALCSYGSIEVGTNGGTPCGNDNFFSHQSFCTVRALASWVPAPAIWWNASAAKRRAKKICPWLSRWSWLGWNWGGWLAGLDFLSQGFFDRWQVLWWPNTSIVKLVGFSHERMVNFPAGVVSGLWLGRWCVFIWMYLIWYVFFLINISLVVKRVRCFCFTAVRVVGVKGWITDDMQLCWVWHFVIARSRRFRVAGNYKNLGRRFDKSSGNKITFWLASLLGSRNEIVSFCKPFNFFFCLESVISSLLPPRSSLFLGQGGKRWGGAGVLGGGARR